MIDPRFYVIQPQTAAVLASGQTVLGDPSIELRGVAPAGAATAGDLCYAEKGAGASGAAAGLLIHLPGVSSDASARIETKFPRALFARLAAHLIDRRRHDGDAAIHLTAQLEEGVRVGPGAVIGPGAMIGAGADIGPNAVIGPGVAIGRRTRIGAGCAISCALIGDDTAIYAGVVIGEAGFGVARDNAGPVDVPHFGRVIIQDRVTIGANSTIDRGLFDDTVIGEDTKIDNLSHIAHQVKIGRGAVIAAYAGISGSTVIGDGVTMGGRVGLGDHRNVGAGAVLAAGSIVLQDVPEGETWGGYPARPIRKFLREVAWLARKAGTRDGGH